MVAEVEEGRLGAKLSLVRFTFNYFISETVFDYLVEAVHLLADEGWKLLPLYGFDSDTGLWQHRGGPLGPELSLADFSVAGRVGRPARPTAPESVLPGYLRDARRILRELDYSAAAATASDPPVPPRFEGIRWFPFPGEALAPAS